MPYPGWMRGVRPGVRVAEEGLGVSDLAPPRPAKPDYMPDTLPVTTDY